MEPTRSIFSHPLRAFILMICVCAFVLWMYLQIRHIRAAVRELWTEIAIVKEDPVMMNSCREFQLLFGMRQKLRKDGRALRARGSALEDQPKPPEDSGVDELELMMPESEADESLNQTWTASEPEGDEAIGLGLRRRPFGHGAHNPDETE